MRKLGAALLCAAILSNCSFIADTLWPFDDGPAERIPIAPSRAEAQPQPTLGPAAPTGGPAAQAVRAAPLQPEAAAQTGTLVGLKVSQWRGELSRLQDSLRQQNSQLQALREATTQNAQRYHGTVAAVAARLQLGTTPGNPVLVSQWNQAQAELDRISAEVGQMNALSNQVAANSSLAAYILESARAAYGLTGAIDEDHRQLALLEDDTNRTVVLVDRLLNALNEDIARQTTYVGNERGSLTVLSNAIKNGELFGGSLLSRAYASGTQPMAFTGSATPRSGFAASGRRPLVVIRFDRPDVPFQQALYTAVSQALERTPAAQFEVVAVTSGRGNVGEGALSQSQAKRHANDVMRSLTDMGLPANRVTLATASGGGSASSEVHVYLR